MCRILHNQPRDLRRKELVIFSSMTNTTKEFAEAQYERWLRFAVRELGDEVTNGQQLQAFCSQLFKKKFAGVFPSDQIPKLKPGTCAIANVDKSGEPGTHWVALTHGLFYDSFGRTHTSLIGHAMLKQIDTDLDREQGYSQDNCGARCVAFLIVAMVYGDKVAKFI